LRSRYHSERGRISDLKGRRKREGGKKKGEKKKRQGGRATLSSFLRGKYEPVKRNKGGRGGNGKAEFSSKEDLIGERDLYPPSRTVWNKKKRSIGILEPAHLRAHALGRKKKGRRKGWGGVKADGPRAHYF